MAVNKKKSSDEKKNKDALTAGRLLAKTEAITGLASPTRTEGKFIRPRIHIVGSE